MANYDWLAPRQHWACCWQVEYKIGGNNNISFFKQLVVCLSNKSLFFPNYFELGDASVKCKGAKLARDWSLVIPTEHTAWLRHIFRVTTQMWRSSKYTGLSFVNISWQDGNKNEKYFWSHLCTSNDDHQDVHSYTTTNPAPRQHWACCWQVEYKIGGNNNISFFK